MTDISILTNIYFHVLGKIPMCALNLPEQQHKSPNVFPDQFCKFKQKIAKCWHKRLQLCSIQMFNSLTLTLHVFGDLFWQKNWYFYFKFSPTFSKLIKKSSQIRRQIVFDTKTSDNHSKRMSLHSRRQGRRTTREKILGRNFGEKILGRKFEEKILRVFPSEAVCVVLSCSASGAFLGVGRHISQWDLISQEILDCSPNAQITRPYTQKVVIPYIFENSIFYGFHITAS